jgi:hypothetical protein
LDKWASTIKYPLVIQIIKVSGLFLIHRNLPISLNGKVGLPDIKDHVAFPSNVSKPNPTPPIFLDSSPES